jgi:hypothetical protein
VHGNSTIKVFNVSTGVIEPNIFETLTVATGLGIVYANGPNNTCVRRDGTPRYFEIVQVSSDRIPTFSNIYLDVCVGTFSTKDKGQGDFKAQGC